MSALVGDGSLGYGAEPVELTRYLDACVLTPFPAGTRLICRRERPRPGAQPTLFDTMNGFGRFPSRFFTINAAWLELLSEGRGWHTLIVPSGWSGPSSRSRSARIAPGIGTMER